VGLALALTLVPGRAGAQPAPAPPAPATVLPPKLLHDPGVVYPVRAIGEHYFEKVSVGLVLELDAAGAVRKATVETPRGHGFDEAALVAAYRLKFAPATRSGVPVAARIRFRYDFAPPPPKVSGRLLELDSDTPLVGARVTVTDAAGVERSTATASDGTWSVSDLAPGKARVVVEADQHETQETLVLLEIARETNVVFHLVLAPKEVVPEQTPAGKKPAPKIEVVVRGQKLAPAVRSFSRSEVRQLPGAFGDPFRAIEALPGVTPILSGLPFFYIRGAPPGNVGYFLDGVRVPLLYHLALGPSVVHPAMVDRVDLYSGGYPAQFGRYAGGIVSAETTEPRADFHGEYNLRLFDVGAMAETGFAGGRGTVLLGGRYSYTAAIISLVAPNTKLDYRDYQARVSYQLGPKDRLTAFGFGSYDLLGQYINGILNVVFGTEFYRVDLRYDHAFPGGSMRTALTLGYDQTIIAEGRRAQDRLLGLRTHVEQQLEPGVLWRFGADTMLDAYTADHQLYSDPDDPGSKIFNDLFPPRNDLAWGSWSDFVLDVTPRIEVTPGLRLDVYASGGRSLVGIDPRIAARFKVSDKVRIVHAYGIAHQPPSFVVPVPGLTPGNLQGGLQTSAQTSAGVEVDVADATTASGTLFYNAFFDMTDALGTSNSGRRPNFDARSQGYGVGLELFLHRKLTKRLGGFFAYTLSRSMRYLGNESFPSAFDRTHVLSTALGYDLGRHWRAGSRFVFYTGTPKTNSSGALVTQPRASSPDRNPAFWRIDVRLEKRWQLAKSAWISFVAECMNVTLNKETFNDTEIGPVTIPSVGVEGGF
jgi:TonB family protein